MGRWTRTMQSLGAKTALSVDVSESALRSTTRFNPNTLKANVMELPSEHLELEGKFDFGNFWGVAMCFKRIAQL
jgi:fructose-1-phosphate kinase PfkB-like protein